jgi:HAD superfamily hydrolase (TIGR01484 family)
VRNIPKLVATDLDGTIVRSDGTISARTVAAFARVQRAGGRFVVVTGRPPRMMTGIAQAFGHAGTAICANGALAYDMRTGAAEALQAISADDLAAAAKALRAAIPGIGIAVEYADGFAADSVYRAVNAAIDRTIRRVSDDELFARPGAKLLGRHYGYTPDELLALAAPLCAGIVNISHSNGAGLVEASALGVSKGTALAEIAARRGIGPEEVLAFGDMPNDLPMLTWAGTSCAVANAHPDVLATATHIIGGVDADGVAAYLESLFPA